MAAARARSAASKKLSNAARTLTGAFLRGIPGRPPRLDGGGSTEGKHHDPEKLAGTDQAEQDRVLVEEEDADHAGRRAARAWLWPHPRQRAAPRASVFAARCGCDRRADRRRSA